MYKMKTVFCFGLLLVLVSENLSSAKETALKRSDKSNPHQKLHEDKQRVVLSNKARIPQGRDTVKTCEIICRRAFPLPPPSPGILNGGYDHPVAPPVVKPTTSAPSTTTSTTEASTESEETTDDTDTDYDTDESTSNSTGQSKNITSKFKKPMKHRLSQTIRMAAPKELAKTLDPGVRKTNYRRLSNRQKHILLKQLTLGNRHAKGTYNYRQINPYQCEVSCHVEYVYNPYGAQSIPVTSNQGGDDTEGDSYEEGEDQPIEITYRPNPQNQVNFMDMDDFGPSGELAADPWAEFEERRHRKKTEKAKLRKKAAVVEKRNKSL